METKKVCAKCDKEKAFKEFNPGMASHGLKRVCIDCEENLNIHYRQQQVEICKSVVKIRRKEKSDQVKKERQKSKTAVNTELGGQIEKELKNLIYFPKEKINGQYKTAKEIIEDFELDYPKGLIYRALAKNALKGKLNGITRYYVKYRDV